MRCERRWSAGARRASTVRVALSNAACRFVLRQWRQRTQHLVHASARRTTSQWSPRLSIVHVCLSPAVRARRPGWRARLHQWLHLPYRRVYCVSVVHAPHHRSRGIVGNKTVVTPMRAHAQAPRWGRSAHLRLPPPSSRMPSRLDRAGKSGGVLVQRPWRAPRRSTPARARPGPPRRSMAGQDTSISRRLHRWYALRAHPDVCLDGGRESGPTSHPTDRRHRAQPGDRDGACTHR